MNKEVKLQIGKDLAFNEVNGDKTVEFEANMSDRRSSTGSGRRMTTKSISNDVLDDKTEGMVGTFVGFVDNGEVKMKESIGECTEAALEKPADGSLARKLEQVIKDGYELLQDPDGLKNHHDTGREGSDNTSPRSTIYDDMLRIYVDRSKGMNYEENPRKDPMVWFSLFVLASNPLVGVYLLYHFNNWQPWINQTSFFTNGSGSDSLSFLAKLPLKGLISNWLTRPNETATPPASIVKVANIFARVVQEYAFFEVFGEIGFALFSLVLIILSRLPCSNKKYRIQSMFPCIAMIYMVVYKVLALYILTSGIRLLFFYFFVLAFPETPIPQQLLRILAIPIDGDDLTVFRELYRMDVRGHFWVMLFCAENIYITVTDTIELFYTVSKLTARSAKKLVAKLKRRQESLYYTLAPGESGEYTSACSSCSYVLMDGQSGEDLHEKYIHSMYNDRTDVGTYLKNVDIKEYSRGLENFTAKLLKQSEI